MSFYPDEAAARLARIAVAIADCELDLVDPAIPEPIGLIAKLEPAVCEDHDVMSWVAVVAGVSLIAVDRHDLSEMIDIQSPAAGIARCGAVGQVECAVSVIRWK